MKKIVILAMVVMVVLSSCNNSCSYEEPVISAAPMDMPLISVDTPNYRVYDMEGNDITNRPIIDGEGNVYKSKCK